jgi:membrane-anchored mycosin MYCP
MRFATTTRLTAATVAGLLAVLVPVAPVYAQPSAGPADLGDTMAAPPPLPPGTQPPTDFGKPDVPYKQKNQCVTTFNDTVDLPNKPWGQIQLRFDELHRFATGAGQKVAVIDTGVNRHDFFEGRLSGGGDYVFQDDNGLRDCDGHGTEVAGIIAAKPPANSGIGFKGIAPDATIISIRQSSANYDYEPQNRNDPNDQSREAAGNLITLAQAIVRAANAVPHGVINMSVDNCRRADVGPISPAERQVQAALRYAVEVQDVVPVSSAGNLNEGGCPNQNDSPDPNRPKSIVIPPWFSDDVISVAAMERNGDPAKFSVQGPWVTVAAPGTEITSLDPGNNKGLANRLATRDGKKSEIQGTSFASPYVAGLAALIRDRYKQLDARQVMNRIKVTASHPAATGGRDSLVGYGMINPIAALTAEIPSEQGIAADKAITIPWEVPEAARRDWAPMTVALLGSAGGLGVLLLTLFVVHTIRRNRRAQEPDARPGW